MFGDESWSTDASKSFTSYKECYDKVLNPKGFWNNNKSKRGGKADADNFFQKGGAYDF